MIPGIVASQLLATAGGTPAPAPIMSLDFVNGVYSVNGSSAAAADVINHPALVGASGLELLYIHETDPGDAVTDLIGAALTVALSVNWTMVVEYQELSNSGTTNIFMIENSPPDFNKVNIVRENSFRDIYGLDNSDTALDSRQLNISGPFDAGIHRIALSRTDARLAISVDGGSVATDEDDVPNPVLVTAAFGGASGDFLANELYLRSLVMYDVLADAALPSLSAV